MTKVSVIIPVYNTEQYLRRSLDSVCNQTLSDIEIICIDDCSKDNSLEILKEYAHNDKRIKIIEFKENKGAAVARNAGIIEAEGEYVGFVDSDDFVDLNFYEKLYNKANISNADISKGAYFYTVQKYVAVNINEKIKKDKNNFAMDYCSAIFKKELLDNNNICFENLIDMEDPIFAFKCAICANRVEIVDDAFINICTRDDSQTAGIPSFERIQSKLKGLKKLVEIANSYPISEECYGYVLALWFSVNTNNILLNESCEALEYFKKEIFEIYSLITLKDNFLKNIMFFSKELHILLSKGSNSLFDFYRLSKENNELIKKIEENKILINKLEELLKNQNKKNIIVQQQPDIYMISVVNDFNLYNSLVVTNPFIKNCRNLKLVPYDNTKENIGISERYNHFLKHYDYSKDAWFIFCHSDWELIDDLDIKIQNLSKDHIYGIIGVVLDTFKDKIVPLWAGSCFEKQRNGDNLHYNIGQTHTNNIYVDTFDCQFVMFHSSLVKKYNLLFDENLLFDLYVEDFCINAKLRHNIKSKIIDLVACHWSDAGYKGAPKSYLKALAYLNNKYPNNNFGGTVSIIGGKKYKFLENDKEKLLYELHKRAKKSIQGEVNA